MSHIQRTKKAILLHRYGIYDYIHDKGNNVYNRTSHLIISFNVLQVALLLEYCSKGDLKSYLIHHREEIEKELIHFSNSGFTPSTTSSRVTFDVKLLHRWVYQVCICYILF